MLPKKEEKESLFLTKSNKAISRKKKIENEKKIGSNQFYWAQKHCKSKHCTLTHCEEID